MFNLNGYLMADQFSNRSVKLINKSRVLQYLYWNSCETQMNLSKSLRLSLPTITQAIQDFKEMGLLQEGDATESSGGRKPRLIAFNFDAYHSIGVEIRRHHVYIVAINLKGDVVYECTYKLLFENKIEYWSTINAMISRLTEETPVIRQILGVGIAFPGELSADKIYIERATVLGVKNEPLPDLQQIFDYDVDIDYAAHMGGFGAVWLAQGLSDAVYLIVTDNGIAGSLILNNQIFRGSCQNGKSGAFGHMVLVPDGKPCFCGGKGCWSTYCALSNLYELTDNDLNEFFMKLEKGDSGCLSQWEDYLTYFAQALANIRLGLDMNIIVGGKIARYLKQYLPMLIEKIKRYPSLKDDTDFLSLDSSDGNAMAIGAALVFVDRLLTGESWGEENEK